MKTLRASQRLMVALDVGTAEEAKALTEKIGDGVTWYKVGMELFYAEGPKVIEMLKEKQKKVFLDLKFHDIPNTVAGAVRSVSELGVDMCNLHACGGREMMQRAMDANKDAAAKTGKPPAKIIGVTILTSMDQHVFQTELGFSGEIREKVLSWAELVKEAGLDGVVASAHEAEMIKKKCGGDFLIVTPGIRPKSSEVNDQKRVMDPAQALKNGATHLVVGRPIAKAENPAQAAERILKEMEEVL